MRPPLKHKFPSSPLIEKQESLLILVFLMPKVLPRIWWICCRETATQSKQIHGHGNDKQ
jgi:hypothetical protein